MYAAKTAAAAAANVGGHDGQGSGILNLLKITCIFKTSCADVSWPSI